MIILANANLTHGPNSERGVLMKTKVSSITWLTGILALLFFLFPQPVLASMPAPYLRAQGSTLAIVLSAAALIMWLMLIVTLGIMVTSWVKQKNVKFTFLVLSPSLLFLLVMILNWFTKSPLGHWASLAVLVIGLALGFLSDKWVRFVPFTRKLDSDKKNIWAILLILLVIALPLSETMTRVFFASINETNGPVLFTIVTLALGLVYGLAAKIYRLKNS